MHRFVKTNRIPLVIDEDALNILPQNQQWLTFLPEKTILTPHQKELERLIGKWDSVPEKIEKTITFFKQNNLVIDCIEHIGKACLSLNQ